MEPVSSFYIVNARPLRSTLRVLVAFPIIQKPGPANNRHSLQPPECMRAPAEH